MTVADVIKRLQKLPKKAEVVVQGIDFSSQATEIEYSETEQIVIIRSSLTAL